MAVQKPQEAGQRRQSFHAVFLLVRSLAFLAASLALWARIDFSQISFAMEGFCSRKYNINTPEGGTHLVGFRNALTKTFNDYARSNKLLKESEPNLSGEDIILLFR